LAALSARARGSVFQTELLKKYLYSERSPTLFTRATQYSPARVIGTPAPQPPNAPRTFADVVVGDHTLNTTPFVTGVAPTGACASVVLSIVNPPSTGGPSVMPLTLRKSVSLPSVSWIT